MDNNSIDNRLLNILEMDFDDMAKEDTNYFRNRIREEFRVSADYVTLNKTVCRTAFCLLKRKYVKVLETVMVRTRPTVKNGGVFGVRSKEQRPLTVPVWDHLLREKVGSFSVVPDTYPIIDVRFVNGGTILTLLVEQGFIEVDSTHFDFTII